MADQQDNGDERAATRRMRCAAHEVQPAPSEPAAGAPLDADPTSRALGPVSPDGGAAAPRARRGGRAARLAAAPPPRAAISPAALRPAADDGSTLLLACGALAREIRALIALNGWRHFTLRCLPAELHLRPEKIAPAIAAAVEADPRPPERIKVVYADCGTGGALEAQCAALGVEMIPGPHCYAFFDGAAAFAARGEAEMRAFYLTDFLVRQFDAFVWRPMGLDRHPELLADMFGGYEVLVHLAQVEDPALDAAAQEAARRLGLAHRRRMTGYGDLEAFLAGAMRGAGDGPEA